LFATQPQRQITDNGIAAYEIAARPKPSATRALKVHAPIWSPPRYTKVSMMFFALYLSSRFTTVNNTSIAGLVIAKLPARRITVSTASAAIPGMAPSAPKPTTLNAGSNASADARPSQRMIRPVKKICVTTVNTCAANSSCARTAVRAALLA
jgi:hypothetical protein